MSPTELRETIAELLYDHGQDEGVQIDVESFEDAGLLTRDEGFIARFPDGSEFQVAIIKSGGLEDDDDE